MENKQRSLDELMSLIDRAAADDQVDSLLTAINPDQMRGLAVAYAAKKGHLEIIQELLKNDATISQEDRGKAVINAATEGHSQVIKELLKNSAAITQQDWKCAFRCAVENDHFDSVSELAENVPLDNRSKSLRRWSN